MQTELVITDRRLSVSHPAAQINGWMFRFGNDPFGNRISDLRLRASLDQGLSLANCRTGDAWRIPVNRQGRLLGVDRKPLLQAGTAVSLNGECGGGNPAINYWEAMLGLNGALPASRRIIEDKERFFRNFLRVVREGRDFSFALRAAVDHQGGVLFKSHSDLIHCPLRRIEERDNPLANSPAIWVPLRIADSVRMFSFPASGGPYLGSTTYRQDPGLFSCDGQDGATTYFVTTRRKGTLFQAALYNYEFLFTGGDRQETEVMNVTMREQEFVDICTHLGAWGMGKREEKKVENGETKKTVVIGNPLHIQKKEAGIVPQVKIARIKKTDKNRELFYISFGRVPLYWIGKRMAQRYHLSVGDTLEVEPLHGQICALIDRRGSQPVRIPFVLDWVFKDGKFVLDYTTSSDLQRQRMQGLRVIEQTETYPNRSGDLFNCGGKQIGITGYVPWKTDPAAVSALVQDGKDVLFFRDRARFSKMEWGVVTLMARVKSGDKSIPADAAGAESMASAGNALRLRAGAEIFELDDLERAYALYIRAFCLNPYREDYLRAATEIRSRIIVRNRHLKRRTLYRQWMENTFSNPDFNPEIYAKAITDYIGTDEHNPLSVAYVLEIIAGLAQGIYSGNQILYRKVFESFPYVLDMGKYPGRRLIATLRILYRDPRLSFIPEWILTHPTTGREKLFKRRRGKIGIPKKRSRVDLEKLAPREGLSLPAVKRPAGRKNGNPFVILKRDMARAVKVYEQFSNALPKRLRSVSPKLGQEVGLNLMAVDELIARARLIGFTRTERVWLMRLTGLRMGWEKIREKVRKVQDSTLERELGHEDDEMVGEEL